MEKIFEECCEPHGMGDLYAAQIVCVGFHSSQGVGAHAVMMGYHLIKTPPAARGLFILYFACPLKNAPSNNGCCETPR
jgi:hypothetical protein